MLVPKTVRWLVNSTNLRDLLESFPEFVECMVYLRQYGFPSPLLDWSKSSYIAAYFAFSDYQRDAKSVAIFAFLNEFLVRLIDHLVRV